MVRSQALEAPKIGEHASSYMGADIAVEIPLPGPRAPQLAPAAAARAACLT
jgi:hypothetical protein